MKIAILKPFYLVVVLAVFQSCSWFTPKGNGNIVEEDFQVGLFNEIKVNGNFFIHLKQGNEYAVVVRTDENLIDHMEVKLKGNRLVVKSKNALRPSRENHLYITIPELTFLKLNGANTLKTSGIIRSENLIIELNGASNMTMEAEIAHLTVELNGAGEANLSGMAEELALKVNGAGKYNGLEMKTIVADVHINGAGHCEMNVEQLLIASLNGVGRLHYVGEPEVRSSVKGAGSISQIEE